MNSLKSVLLCFILLPAITFPQNITSPAELNTPGNILTFADFLFCSGDYYRASLEYEKYPAINRDDTISFKKALGYSLSENYDEAKSLFKDLHQSSSLNYSSMLEYYKIDLLSGNYSSLINSMDIKDDNPELKKLYYSARMLDGNILPEQESFRKTFSEDDEMLQLFEKKLQPQTRSPLMAGILSAILPGAGKVYTGRYMDGLFAFITTGVMAFLAYDNFRASHEFRGWLFTGLGTLFYAGNIYGSVSTAHEFNINFKAAIDQLIKDKLKKENYFIPVYEFCK